MKQSTDLRELSLLYMSAVKKDKEEFMYQGELISIETAKYILTKQSVSSKNRLNLQTT